MLSLHDANAQTQRVDRQATQRVTKAYAQVGKTPVTWVVRIIAPL
jgi:hypothetical protein